MKNTVCNIMKDICVLIYYFGGKLYYYVVKRKCSPIYYSMNYIYQELSILVFILILKFKMLCLKWFIAIIRKTFKILYLSIYWRQHNFSFKFHKKVTDIISYDFSDLKWPLSELSKTIYSEMNILSFVEMKVQYLKENIR